MKHNLIPKLVSLAVLTTFTSNAWAAGTAAGTNIDNTATINYSVSGTAQAAIGSSEAGNTSGAGTPTTFEVDKKIDLLVTAGTAVSTAPNATATGITFTLKNEGNSTENFELSQTQLGSPDDDFDATSCVTTPASPVNLAADATSTITVTCDIPSSANNAETAKIDLKATAVISPGVPYVESATESAAVVDVVLADGVGSATDTGAETVGTDPAGTRNASHSAVNTYTISGASAALTVTKTSAVIDDPFNGTTNPKRIPGATVEYSIVVSNADGATDATHLVISDPLQTDLTYVTCTLTGDGIVNTVAPSPALGCSFASPTVSSSSFTLPGGTGGTPKTATLTITATVN